MKNVKLSIKLIGGFLVVALITLIVGLIGWRGISLLDEQIEDIGEQHLPAIQSMLTMMSRGESIRVAQRSLLIPNLTAEVRRQQYDNVVQAREDYQKAWKLNESLANRSPEYVNLWKQFVPAWDDWKRENDEFFRLSKELGKTGIFNPTSLRASLQQFRGDHYELIDKVHNLLMNKVEFAGGEDPAKCNFGKWLADFKSEDAGINEILKQMESSHAPFHRGVGKIKQLVHEGNLPAANTVMTREVIPDAEGTLQRFNLLLDEAAKIESVYTTMTDQALVTAREKQKKALEFLNQLIKLEEQGAADAVKTANSAADRAHLFTMIGIAFGVLLALGLGIALTLSITKPLKMGVDFARTMSEGDMSKNLEINRKDEIGVLASALNAMASTLRHMFKDTAAGVETLAASATELFTISGQMSSSATQTSEMSNTVAAASEEMSSNMTSVAAAMEQASSNVNTVATATEEMTATVDEIARNAERARTITGEAVSEARSASARVDELGKAAREIGKITQTITEISDQTNLLALNATIEAARAGEAGKGFAVVANEIKELAKQTAAATEEIKKKIEGIRDSTSSTVTEITQISKVIDDVNEIVSTIAAAVEEQSVTTREIASNIAQAAQGVQEGTENVAQSSMVAGEIAKDISLVNHTANEMSNMSSQVNMSAEELSRISEQLKKNVEKFKI